MNLFPKSKLKIEEPYLSEAKNTLYQNLPQLWDPTNSINYQRIKNQCINLEAQYRYLQANPKTFSFQRKKGFIIGFFGTLFGIITFFIFLDIKISLFLIAISWFYLIAEFTTHNDISQDILKLQVANRKNWLYDPFRNKTKWSKLKKLFPMVFSKGDENQRVENMFWGLFLHQNKYQYFHAGEFIYDELKIDISMKYKKVPKTQHYIIMYNEKNIQSTFMLVPESFKTKFNKNEITTESNEFNKKYSFIYEGSKKLKELNIIKILSPAVQEKLLVLGRKREEISILFHNNYIIFSIQGPIFKKTYTNFKKNPTLDQRDITFLDNELTSLNEISSEILKYLD